MPLSWSILYADVLLLYWPNMYTVRMIETQPKKQLRSALLLFYDLLAAQNFFLLEIYKNTY